MITIDLRLHNILPDQADTDHLDSELLKKRFQTAYDQAFCVFMKNHPLCPHCGHQLYRHDKCSRTVKILFLQIVMIIVIRRVRCPLCGRTHRVLPLFIIPGFQICSDTAAEIIRLHNNGESVSRQSNPLVEPSSAYRFINQMKNRFSAVLTQLKSFSDLFSCCAVQYGSYSAIFPHFLNFPVFQPVP